MEQHSGDFSVTVRDVRQLNQTEGDLLTLLWVLEGSVNLTEAEGVPQPLAADELAIVNRNRRWSLRSAGTNAVMILTLSASWLTRLDSAFFCCRLSDNAAHPGCGGRPAPPDAPAAGERPGQASRPLPTGGQPLAE